MSDLAPALPETAAPAEQPPQAVVSEAVPAHSETSAPAPQSEKRSAIGLRSSEFRKGREQGWRQLEDVIIRAEKDGIGNLSADDAQQLPLLYRATLSSLSVARAIALDRNLVLYLENLSLRAYLVVYGPRTGMMEHFSEFLMRGFPKSVRSMRIHLWLAFLALVAGTIAGFLLVRADMSYYAMLMPESLAGGRGPSSSTEDLRHVIFSPWKGFVDTFIVFANFLFRHNALVGILCFGLGFAFGVPTLLLVIYQGLILGAFIALHYEHGLTIDIIGWLSIHGVTEFLAILLCGAAGFVVAEKMLFPGNLPRLEALGQAGRRAASVVAGAVLMLFIAGIIEGGFRQFINNTPGRYAFAVSTLVLWYLYFTSGRIFRRFRRDIR